MLAQTRWSARSSTFSSIKNGICPLVTSLERLQEENDERAPGFLAVICQFSFVVTLVILASVLLLTNTLSKKLQYETIDLNDSAHYAKTTLSKLKDWVDEEEPEQKEGEENKQDSEFDRLYEEAKRICQILEVDETFSCEIRRQPRQLSLFADLKDYYRKRVFLPFIKTMIEQLDTQLIKSAPHFRAIWLLPTHLDFSYAL